MKKIFTLLVVVLLTTLMASCNTGGPNKDYVYVTPVTDSLKLTEAWEGKSFIESGIGVVTVNQNVDGDTTIFREEGKGSFTVRYNGIDTPESTYKVEPWGFAASDFTKEKLNKADKIVLQADSTAADKRKDSNGRYLAWVWYRPSADADFRLLNAEIIENGFSASKASGTRYSKELLTADAPLQKAKVHIWGEKDNTYDDSEIGESLTIKELREKYTTLNVSEQNRYKGKVVRITGIVTRNVGIGSGYLQQYDQETDTYYGVYVYGGFKESILLKGREVYVQGKIGYYNGSLQVTDLDRDNSGIISFKSDIHSVEVTINDVKTNFAKYQGQLIHITNLTVTTGYNSKDEEGKPTKAFTLTVKDAAGNSIEIRVGNDFTLIIEGENNDERISAWEYFKGKTITDLYALVGWYSFLNSDETAYEDDGTQLLLVSGQDIKL